MSAQKPWYAINEFVGACLSLVLAQWYTYLYLTNLGESRAYAPYFWTCFWMFEFGVILLYARRVPMATQAQLVLAWKSLPCFWSDGVWLVPSFPTLRYLGLNFLYDLYVHQPALEAENIVLYRDQRKPQVNHNVEMSLLTSKFLQAIDRFFSLPSLNSPFFYPSLGFKIMVVAVCWGSVQSYWYKSASADRVKGKQVATSNLTKDRLKGPEIRKDYELLRHTDPPQFPGNDIFEKNRATSGFPASPVTTPNGRRILYTSQNKNYTDAEVRTFRVDESKNIPIAGLLPDDLCMAVAGGVMVYFQSTLPPKVARNMEGMVMYLDGRTKESHTSTWEYVHDNWASISMFSNVFIAAARSGSDLRDGMKGGYVCF